MSFDWRTMERNVATWAQGAFPGVPDESVIWADQNIDQPPYPFVTLKKDAFADTSEDSEIVTVDDGEGGRLLQSRAHAEFTLTIRTHVDEREVEENGDNAFSMLADLVARLNLPAARDELCEAGLAIITRSPVLDISSTTNNKWVSRATVDIRVRAAVINEEPVEYFESVEVDGKLDSKTQSFTVPETP